MFSAAAEYCVASPPNLQVLCWSVCPVTQTALGSTATSGMYACSHACMHSFLACVAGYAAEHAEFCVALSLTSCLVPLPILSLPVQVKSLPEDVTPEQILAAFGVLGVPVNSAVIEERDAAAKGPRSALVRLPAPALPWTLTPEDLATHPLDAVLKAAEEAAAAVTAAEEAAAAEVAAAAAAAAAATAAVAETAKAAEAEVGAEGAVAGETATSAEPSVEAAAGGEAVEAAAPAVAADTAVAVVPPAAVKRSVAAVALVSIPADDGRKDGDTGKVARYYAARISNTGLVVAGKRVVVEQANIQATLFLGNLPEDDGPKLRGDMEKYGPLERCFIMRNTEGLSKVRLYGAWGQGTRGRGRLVQVGQLQRIMGL